MAEQKSDWSYQNTETHIEKYLVKYLFEPVCQISLWLKIEGITDTDHCAPLVYAFRVSSQDSNIIHI